MLVVGFEVKKVNSRLIAPVSCPVALLNFTVLIFSSAKRLSIVGLKRAFHSLVNNSSVFCLR